MRYAAASIVVFAACSSNTSQPAMDMSAPPGVSDVCKMVDGARQTARLACSGVMQSFALVVYDAVDCGRQQRAADAGYVTLDRAQVAKCLAAIQSASCDTLALGEPAECAAIYVPQSAAGGACFDARQCKSGTTCLNVQCPGVCTKLGGDGEPCGPGCAPPLVCNSAAICEQPVALGASCQTRQCPRDLYCDFAASTPTCQPRKPAGMACQGTLGDCQEPLACVGGVCAHAPKLGEACGGTLGRCDFGLACDDASHKCVVWRGDGAVCHGEYECAPDFICTTPGGGDGTCVPWLEAGATCDPNAYRCRMPTVCSNGTCALTNNCI